MSVSKSNIKVIYARSGKGCWRPKYGSSSRSLSEVGLADPRRSERNWVIEGRPEKVRKSHVRASMSRQNASWTKRFGRAWVLEVEMAVENAENHAFAMDLGLIFSGMDAPSLSRVGRGVFGTGELAIMGSEGKRK